MSQCLVMVHVLDIKAWIANQIATLELLRSCGQKSVQYASFGAFEAETNCFGKKTVTLNSHVLAILG